MINDHLDKTIACLVADAEYLSDFEFKLDSFNGRSKEDQQNMVKSAFILILHIIDYYVTANMIDMEADIFRFCQRDPAGASKFADKINLHAGLCQELHQRLFQVVRYDERIP